MARPSRSVTRFCAASRPAWSRLRHAAHCTTSSSRSSPTVGNPPLTRAPPTPPRLDFSPPPSGRPELPHEPGGGEAPGPAEPLSAREAEVLRWLHSQLSLREIASRLFVSYYTVKTHTRHIYRKLGVSNRQQAIAWTQA